jgi:hypothetical protein
MERGWTKGVRIMALVLLVPLWSCGYQDKGGDRSGSSDSPTTPEPLPDGLVYEFQPTSIQFDHRVGESPCPQLVGEVVVKNTSTRLQVFKLRENLPEAEPLTVEPTVRTAKPGEVIKFKIFFDCSQQLSFTKILTFDATDEKAKDVSTVTVVGKIRF